MSNEEQVGRLAMRQEGGFWVAYYAQTDSMKDAIDLGRVKMDVVYRNAERKEAFMSLMADYVNDIIEEAIGTRPSFRTPVKAPEHERSGNA